MRYYLPDEDKLFKKIQKIPIEHHKKEELINKLSLEEAKTWFRYEDGKLYYKKSSGNKKIGDEVGYIRKISKYQNYPYLTTTLKRKFYPVGKIIFLLIHGYYPKHLIYIDGNRLNNNIENLTCCSYSIINYKLRPIKNNTNLKGVYYCKFRNRYKVRFNVNYKTYNIGSYKDIETAKRVYNIIAKRVYDRSAYLNN